jgi:predicted O-linked N-acetylglucosamine transferase (SPINDLY family)
VSEAAERLIRDGRRAESEGRLEDACKLYRRAATEAPGHAKAHLNLGAALEALQDLDGAAAAYEAAVAADAADAYASYNLGRLRYLSGALPQAEALLARALEGKPDFTEAAIVLANVQRAQGRPAQAATALEAALRGRPDDPGALSLYAVVLGELGRWREAESALRRALAADASDADRWYWLGNALAGQEQPREAAGHYRRALALQPDHAAAWCNLGHVLAELGERDEPARCFERALSLRPQHADALVGIGNLHVTGRRLGDAADCYRRALALDPTLAEAQLNLGHVLRDQGEAEAAMACYRAALALRPDYAEARWSAAMALVPVHRESSANLEQQRAQFHAGLSELAAWFESATPFQGARAVGVQQPFWLAYQERDNRPLLENYGRLCTRLMGRWGAERSAVLQGLPSRQRIRVAILSQYFRDHSVWNAIVKGWFAQLDRQRFELFAFSLGADEDVETAYARSRADRFESGPRPLQAWMEAIGAARPDVMLYPEVGMDPMSAKLASLRLAPVQAAAWGHPETSGLPTIDYYLSSELLEPADAQSHYSERLIRLPALGCCVERAEVRAVPPEPERWGIAPDSALLLCPGVPFKYPPEHDGLLAEIARRVPQGKLVFFTYWLAPLSDKLRQRLRAAFARAGLELDRHAVFVPWQPRAAFYGWLERATVFLDTLGFSGFNTALQAAECALPLATREGRFMRGRLASGIARRMGLDELVARSDEEYIALAVRLAQDGAYRESIRSRMRSSQHVLFGDVAPIRALEGFLAQVARGS